VIADYAGYAWNDSANRLIASSFAGGDIPAAFPSWQLVPGLEKAMVGAKVGSRLVTVIPPKDGYGAKGAPQLQISGQDSLVYVLDVVATFPEGVGAKGQAQPLSDSRCRRWAPRSRAGPVGDGAEGRAAEGSPGAGADPGHGCAGEVRAGAGPSVRGYLWRDGKSFDSSYAAGHPFSTVIGPSRSCRAGTRGSSGRRWQPHAAHRSAEAGVGAKGLRQSGIKGDDTLVYVVDILGAY